MIKLTSKLLTVGPCYAPDYACMKATQFEKFLHENGVKDAYTLNVGWANRQAKSLSKQAHEQWIQDILLFLKELFPEGYYTHAIANDCVDFRTSRSSLIGPQVSIYKNGEIQVWPVSEWDPEELDQVLDYLTAEGFRENQEIENCITMKLT
jgi:hypothetical protein